MQSAAAERVRRLHVVRTEEPARKKPNLRLLESERPQGEYLARSDAELRINRLVSPGEREHYVRAGERLGSALLRLQSGLRSLVTRLASRSAGRRERGA
ncbi:MAG: hypothetical protein ACRED5_10840 [Propylenella sp.]